MAKTFPIEIPTIIQQDERRSAEIKVFEKLRSLLSDEWHVYYSRPWWGLNHTGGEKDGEADFVVVHPDKGMLFIEVKGGQVSYDPILEQWSSTDRNGLTFAIKNPVRQAMVCCKELTKKFSQQNGWPLGRVTAHYGVVLVDTIASKLPFIAGYESKLFCYAQEFDDDFLSWIEQRLTAHVGSDEIGLGQSGIEVVNQILAKPITLRTTLGRQAEMDISVMNRLLTGIQLQAVAEAESCQRLVVDGGAGTGKTIVALELASRMSEEGAKVALSCVGTGLLADFKVRLSSMMPSLQLISVDDLLESKSLFDCIIIDEGQDVAWDDWDRIDALAESFNSKLIVFMDANQAVYQVATNLATRLNAKAMTLRVNLRNTQEIAKVVDKLYQGPPTKTAGPQGLPTQFIRVNNDQQAIEIISKQTLSMSKSEGVNLGDIAILSSSKDFLRRIRSTLSSLRILHGESTRRTVQSVTVDSVRSFKGLESPFIFLYLDADASNNREISYVGTSRARTNLFAYGTSEKALIAQAILNREMD